MQFYFYLISRIGIWNLPRFSKGPIFPSIYFYSCCSLLEHRVCMKLYVSLQFPNLRQLVGPLGLWDQSVARPLNRFSNRYYLCNSCQILLRKWTSCFLYFYMNKACKWLLEYFLSAYKCCSCFDCISEHQKQTTLLSSDSYNSEISYCRANWEATWHLYNEIFAYVIIMFRSVCVRLRVPVRTMFVGYSITFWTAFFI
jgi:hypothetical protein